MTADIEMQMQCKYFKLISSDYAKPQINLQQWHKIHGGSQSPKPETRNPNPSALAKSVVSTATAATNNNKKQHRRIGTTTESNGELRAECVKRSRGQNLLWAKFSWKSAWFTGRVAANSQREGVGGMEGSCNKIISLARLSN